MTAGESRAPSPRLRVLLFGAAVAIVSASALTMILGTAAVGVARAAPLDSPTPTLDPLIVPTTVPSSGSGLTTTALSTSSAGIALALGMSCLTTIAGLIIAILTLRALIRTGYGPFLRVILPRWLGRRLPAPPPGPTLRYRPNRDGPETGFDIYAEQPLPRGGRQTRRRDEWSDWDDAPPARQSHSSHSSRGSSRGSSPRSSRSH
ncbi:MAG TPA: hypothetical protein VF808_02975 [Ktedonobacterales bacterium]